MKVVIETDSRYDKDFILELNPFHQTILTIGGKETPFVVVFYEEISHSSWDCRRGYITKKYHLEEIDSLIVETEVQKLARIAVKQAEKSLQCAKDVLKNTGVI